MAAAPKLNLGMMPCPCCHEPVALKKSATGKLSYQCQDADCEATGFADQSAASAKKWLGAVQPRKGAEQPAPAPVQAITKPIQRAPAAPAKVPTTQTPSAPPKVAPRPAFDLGAL